MKRKIILLSILLLLMGVFFVGRSFRSASGPQTLYEACADDNIEAVRDFLSDEQTDVNTPEKNGETPLHVAAGGQNPQLVRLLIEHGANVNAKNNSLFTPMMYAAEYCKSSTAKLQTIKYLIEKGAEVNAQSKNGWTALMLVCKNGKPGAHRQKAVEHLIKKGADVNMATNYGWTALLLLFYEQDPGEDGLVISKMLIEKGADVNAKNKIQWTPFMSAVRFGEPSAEKLKTVRYLLKKGANVNAKNKHQWTPLMHAVNNGKAGKEKIALITLLIEKGASINAVNKYKESAIFFAQDVQTLSLLLENGAHIDLKNRRERSPLMHALVEGRDEVAKLLIEKGCNINLKDLMGRNALLLATQYDRGELIDLLLQQGAEAGAKTPFGETALYYASKKGSAELISTLIKKGDPIDLKGGYYKWPPVSYACRWGNYDAVKVLVENGAALNVYSDEGWTPTMYAVYGNFEPIIQLLKKHHPDFNNEVKLLNENAAPYYLRAMNDIKFFAKKKVKDKCKAVIASGWKKDNDIEIYLENRKEAETLVLEGIKKKHCDWSYFYKTEKEKETVALLLDFKLDRIYDLFLLKGRKLQAENRYPQAVEHYFSMLTFLQHINGPELKRIIRASLVAEEKILAAIGEFLDTIKRTAGPKEKYAELYRIIDRKFEQYKRKTFSPVALVQSEKEYVLEKLDHFVRRITKSDLKRGAAKIQLDANNAAEEKKHEALLRMVNDIFIHEGKQMVEHYYQYYINAARSNSKEDWRAADAQLEKLTAEMQKNKEGLYVYAKLDELEKLEKFSKETAGDALRKLVKMLIASDMTKKMKKYVSLYNKNLSAINGIQTRLSSVFKKGYREENVKVSDSR
jgi:ankyrin repeat protein